MTKEAIMADRIDVEEARRKVTAGEAFLVCAYEDEAKCDRMKLEGSMSLPDFRTLAESLPKDREIIFYCA
jgi:hypothetical protein